MSTLKLLSLITGFIFFGFFSNAQIVEIESGTQGIVFPRVTATTDVSAPAEGMVVYQTGIPEGLYQYDGSSWSIIGGGGSSTPSVIGLTLFSNVGTKYGGPYTTAQHNSESEARLLMPAGTLSELRVRFDDSTADGNIVITVMKNGSDTEVTCTIGNGSNTCSDLSHSIIFSGGDGLTFRAVNGGTFQDYLRISAKWVGQ